jgi:S1-C subfamily serine protease
VLAAVATLPAHAGDVAATVLSAQQQRIDVMRRASAAAVAIFAGEAGGGSGVLISPDGYALTNFHVVQPAGIAMKCGLADGRLYDAVLVGLDPTGDVALVKLLGRHDFPWAELADSDDVEVGDFCFAAGNPFLLATDFQPSISAGIVSGMRRYQFPAGTILEYADCLQVDAAINPGNSGGPLLDSGSRLIGMNTAIASRTGQSSGVGFAIPVGTLARIVPQLIQRGKVIRPDAGIARVYQTDKGLLVAALAPEGPAERAGMRGFKGVRERRRQGPFTAEFERVDRSGADLIVAVAGEPVRTADDFLSAIDSRNPGDQVLIAVEREGHRLDLPVILDAEK